MDGLGGSDSNFAMAGTYDVRSTCNTLPGSYGQDLVLAVKTALSVGNGNAYYYCGSSQIGSNTGARAKGYVTIDVVSYCSQHLPTDAGYFSGPTAAILYDNVLFGDYQQIGAAPAFDAQGSPMVHIRAVPEGGLSGASGGEPIATSLPFTFYDRYTPAAARTADRRQPLPSVWGVRYIQSNRFATDFKIWREGLTGGSSLCKELQRKSSIEMGSIIRFDQHENLLGLSPELVFGEGCCPASRPPATSRVSTAHSMYPPETTVEGGSI